MILVRTRQLALSLCFSQARMDEKSPVLIDWREKKAAEVLARRPALKDKPKELGLGPDQLSGLDSIYDLAARTSGMLGV